MRHKVILFDIDNTLTTSGGVGRRAMERALLEVTGVKAPPPRVGFAGRTDTAILRDLLGHLGRELEAGVMEAVFARYLQHLETNIQVDGAGSVLPGVHDTIAALEGPRHIHMGVLTGNIARGAALKLGAHGLGGRFGFGAYGDDREHRPDLLPVALERWRGTLGEIVADCAPGDIYIVGDTIHDVAVAKAHGARAVAVGTGAPWQERQALLDARPDFFFEDLREARPFIEEVLRG